MKIEIAKNVGRIFVEILRRSERCKSKYILQISTKGFLTNVYYLLAKIGFDTPENEILIVWR